MQETPTCPNCSQIFGTKDPVRPHGPRMPLLLHCGHTFCEGCLTRLAKAHKSSITCPTCQASTTLKVNESTKGLWPDIYMLGLLAVNRSLSLHQDDLKLQTLGMIQAPRRKDSYKAKQPEKELCGECGSRPATCKCLKCECNMCSLCFEKVHKASKVLRKHQAQPLTDDSSSYVVPSTCSKHDNRPIEYFCEDDHVAICSHCVIMGEHREHAITAMEQKNKRALDDLEPVVQTASLVLKRLVKSDKALSKAVPQVRQGIMNVVDDIRAHYHTLHSHLQARELALLEDVERLYQFDGSPIEEMRSKLLDQMRELDCDVKYAQKLLTNNGHTAINAQVLLDKLKHAASMPCYATWKKCEESSIRCYFDDDLVKSILRHGEVRGSSDVKFSMKPLSDVPEDLDEDSDAQSTTTVSDNHDGPVSPTDGDLYSYSEFDSLSQSSETSVRSGSEGGRRKTLQKMRLQNVHQELVYVTHIKHPCQFVIQRCADFRRLKAMSAAINKHCSNPVTRQHIPTELNPGDLVLAKYTLDENWYRGRVIGVVANDEESPSQQKAEVFYVDYGNTEMMPLNRLRMMHRNFLSTPELAVTCSLVDIVPASQNGEWDVEATLTFARMTEDKPMLMTVLREGEITFVDLSKPPSDEIEDDRPVSMRDALVFLELTRFSSPRSVLESTWGNLVIVNSLAKGFHCNDVVSSIGAGTKPKMLKRYLKPEMLRAGSSFRAMVSHVNSVYSFYIQKIGEEARYLVEMMMNLQQIYGADTGDLYTVFCPQKDMICAAQFSADNSWYRAEVTQLAGHRMVTVKYVDFGNEEQLSHWKLRKLRDPFLVLPKQAIHCRLADVEPVNKEQGWSVEALTSLRDFTPNPVMVRVTGVTADGQLLVVLHEAVHDDEEEDIKPSLNTLLVRQGYAHSTGPGSTFTQAAEHLDNHKDKTPARPAGRDKSNSREVNRTAMSSTYVQGEVNRTAPSHVSSSGELDMADDAQVKVLPSHVESPDKIFVQLADTSGLNSLMCDLDTAYQDSNLSDSASWKEKDYCAALYSGNKRWHRAQIMSIKDDIVEVIMLDYGYRDTLNLSFLRPLDEGFLTQSSFCLRCHLTDIQPAGDITRWSCTACEYLVELLSKGMCFIKPKGEVEDGSLATDLLLEERIMGDALSADRVEYNSVTKALLEKGLALPKRRAIAKKPPKPLPETDLPASPDVGSVLPHSANSSVASKIVMATTNGIAEEDASPRNSDDKHKLKEVIVTNKKVDTRVEFPPPDLPTGTDVTLVPTYVDYNCVVFGQEVKPAECTEGRFGFILQEHTLEVIAQDTYFARHCLRRARIPRDGNCLFRALASSAALGGDQTRHTSLRAAVVMTMRANWTEYCNVLGDVDREEYLSDMAKSATYGGEPEIHVLCQLYGVTVRVYLGGLNYRVQYRDYSIHSTQTDLIGAPALVEICYLADSAHYDLVVPEDMDMSYLDHLYNEWRVVRIEQLRHAPSISDVSTYDDSLLQQLMERIQKHYADSSPDTDACWEVGQAIIARYMLDDQFYRAQITKINSDSTVEVHYVDFGNNETVPMERLRKDIILAEVPQQCLGLHLVGIKPVSGHLVGITPVSGHLVGIKPVSVHLVAIKPVSGHLVGITPVSGHLVGIKPVSGHLVAIKPVSGHLVGIKPVSGHFVGIKPVSEHLVGTKPVSGHLVGIKPVSGHLVGIKPVSGHLVAIKPVSGHLVGIKPVSGHFVGIKPVSEHLVGTKPVSGHLVGIKPVSGHLVGIKPVSVHLVDIKPVSGHLVGITPVNGHLMGIKPVSGHLVAIKPVSGHLVGIKPVSGHFVGIKPVSEHLVGTKPVSGHLVGIKPVSGHFVGIKPVSGHLVGIKPVSVHLVGIKPVSGHLVGIKPVSGHLVGIKPVSVHLVGIKPVSVHLVGIKPVSGHLVGIKPVSGHLVGIKPVSGHLVGIKPVSVHLVGIMPVSGHLVGIKPVSGHLVGIKPVSGHLVGIKPVSVHLVGIKPVSGHLVGIKPVSVHLVGIKPVSVHLVGITPVSGHLVGIKPVSVHLVGIKPVSGHLVGITPVSVHLVAIKPVSGHLVGITPVSGHLVGIKPVSGHLVAIKPVSGHLVGIKPVSGHFVGIKPVSEHLVGTKPVSGHLVGIKPVSGHLVGIKPVSGHLVAIKPVSGHLVGIKPVSGHFVGIKPVSEHLVGTKPVSGHLVGIKPVSGHLVGIKPVSVHLVDIKPVSGHLVGITPVSGHLVGIKPVSGHLVAIKPVSGHLVGIKPVSGHFVGIKPVSEHLVGTKPVSGHLVGIKPVSGHLVGIKPVSGHLVGIKPVSGHLVGIKPVSGHLVAIKPVSGHLVGIKPVSGHFVGIKPVSEHLVGTKPVSGHLVGIKPVSGHLVGIKPVSGHLVGIKPVSGHLVGIKQVSGHLVGIKPVSVHLVGIKPVSEHLVGIKPVSVHFVGIKPMSGHLVGIKPVSGHLVGIKPVSVHLVGIKPVSEHLVGIKPVSEHLVGIKPVSGHLVGIKPVSGHLVGVKPVSGHLVDVKPVTGHFVGIKPVSEHLVGIKSVSGHLVGIKPVSGHLVGTKPVSGHLVGIKPCNPGKWPVKVLDYIHHLVVGQTCTVHIQEAPSVGDLVKVTMELSDGRDLATHMFDLGLAAPDEGMEPEVVVAPPTGIPKRTVTSPYGHLTPPEIGDLTLICVTQVSSPTEVYIQYVKQVRAVDPQFVAINRDLDSLLHIADELAQHAASYPSLTDIKPGVACCVQYSVDSCWYRAEVISMETTNGTLRYVGVLYVDYGNTEYVTPDSVKVLPDEFRHLTAQAIPCHLAGVVAPPRPDMPADSVIQALTELFASKILIAIAQSYGDDTLFINLYEHSAFMTFGHDAPLAYKELIDGGQLLSLRHDSDASAIIEEEIEEELDELESAFQLADCDIAERKRPLSWSEQAELEMPLDDASL
ncbi:hypothetical protein LSAT2_008731 [Lamellibrachia satsuma]|nr:hypothetical protein LSAT2_008731 [Lamellibrachia satsuma]